MRLSARIASAIELLSEIAQTFQKPADNVANLFFRSRRYMGSKDRQYVSSTVWTIMRSWQLLSWYARLCNDEPSIRDVFIGYLLLEKYSAKEIEDLFAEKPYGAGALSADEKRFLHSFVEKCLKECPKVPPACRFGVPSWLYEQLAKQWPQTIDAQMRAMGAQAPLDLRVNLLKTTRKDLYVILRKEGLPVEETTISPWGLRLPRRFQVMSLDAFGKGLFEVQDEGSQIVAAVCDVKPGMRVMDYCAGAGGKTLALTMMMENKGYLMACDRSAKRLQAARRRIRKAGVSNTQFLDLSNHEKKIKRKKASFDCVLVDAPCSGTGTLRRHPDIAMRLKEQDVEELLVKQKEILQKASSYVKKGGKLVYATCSLLEEENATQVKAFLAQNTDFESVANESSLLAKSWQERKSIALTPKDDNTDGFFVATMRRVS